MGNENHPYWTYKKRYTVKKAAKILGITPNAIYCAIHDGHIPTTKDEKGRHLISRYWISRYAEERRGRGRSGSPAKLGTLRDVKSKKALPRTTEGILKWLSKRGLDAGAATGFEELQSLMLGDCWRRKRNLEIFAGYAWLPLTSDTPNLAKKRYRDTTSK